MIFIFWYTRRFLAELNESCALQIHGNEDTQAGFELETPLIIHFRSDGNNCSAVRVILVT